jgi:hypothetical protein
MAGLSALQSDLCAWRLSIQPKVGFCSNAHLSACPTPQGSSVAPRFSVDFLLATVLTGCEVPPVGCRGLWKVG